MRCPMERKENTANYDERNKENVKIMKRKKIIRSIKVSE
jgi:hypothetical protein